MLTQVFAQPVNERDAEGHWVSSRSAISGSDTAPADAKLEADLSGAAERSPLAQYDEASCTLASATPSVSSCNASTFQAGAEPVTGARVHGVIQFTLPDLTKN